MRLVKETITRDNEVFVTRNLFFFFFLFVSPHDVYQFFNGFSYLILHTHSVEGVLSNAGTSRQSLSDRYGSSSSSPFLSFYGELHHLKIFVLCVSTPGGGGGTISLTKASIVCMCGGLTGREGNSIDIDHLPG